MDEDSFNATDVLDESEEENSNKGAAFISYELGKQLQYECYEIHANETVEESYCPWTFDGWMCWNSTAPGTNAFVHCPSFIPGFDSSRTAHKVCTENGTWFAHPLTKMPWSNYTTCVNLDQLQSHRTVNLVYIVGYSASLAALILSLLIFLMFRSLQCKRVTIHKNLFSSFIINNSLWLIWILFLEQSSDVLEENGVGCRIFHIILHYFLVSNYFWMFCEGLYLHTLLVVAFVSEDKIIKWIFVIGWGLPAIITVTYASCRNFSIEHNAMCWMEESPYNYILQVPVVISMVVNFFFLINIVRVLVTKLRGGSAADSHSTRKAVRATLILIPLLGVHYILTPFKPPSNSPAEFIYLVCSAAASSLQGLAVALLFCFFNGEVISLFKKKWNQRNMMNTADSKTTVFLMRNSVAENFPMKTSHSGQGDSV